MIRTTRTMGKNFSKILLMLAVTSGAAFAAAPKTADTPPPAQAKAPPTKSPGSKPLAATRPSRIDASLPTQDDIRKAFEAKEYAKVVADVGRVLPLKGDAAAGYDRYELQMLKGEAHLQLKQLKSAGDAFAAAAKETRDEDKAATARATQRMLREAKGLTVQRRFAPSVSPAAAAAPAGPTSVDLLDREKREDALRLTYDNLRGVADPKVKEAVRSRTLPPILDALTALADLRDLETATNTGDRETAASRQELGERARSLLAKELDHTEADVKSIFDSANTITRAQARAVSSLATGSGYDETRYIRRGLDAKDRADLKAAIQTCEQSITAAESLAGSAALDQSAADELVDRAKKVGRSAERALDAKYEDAQSTGRVSERKMR